MKSVTCPKFFFLFCGFCQTIKAEPCENSPTPPPPKKKRGFDVMKTWLLTPLIGIIDNFSLKVRNFKFYIWSEKFFDVLK